MFVKSLSVGKGDMFYICHDSDNFSIIDCCLCEDDKDKIISEIKEFSKNKSIVRFISTHPDQDHINGIKYLFEQVSIPNFYCVNNNAVKKDETEDFKYYCSLRDGSSHFYIEKDCKRKWLNDYDCERRSSGISILWPDVNNKRFIEELEKTNLDESFNNISPIIRYSVKNGPSFLWFGDIEQDFLLEVYKFIDFSHAAVVFAPHHGRKTGGIPSVVLERINPRLIVVGEAPSEYLDYYDGYNTITQNSAGDIIFNIKQMIDIYVSNKENLNTKVKRNNNAPLRFQNGVYLGSIDF